MVVVQTLVELQLVPCTAEHLFPVAVSKSEEPIDKEFSATLSGTTAYNCKGHVFMAFRT